MDAYTRFVAELDPAVLIVTTAHEGERAGCLVGFATQCSIDPLRHLVCLSKANHTWRVAADAEHLVVHAVAGDRRDLAVLFGASTDDDAEVDKFDRVEWNPGPGGIPVLEGSDSWFVAEIVDRVDLGDHTGYVVEPIVVEQRDAPAGPLRYHSVANLDAGHGA